MDVHDPSQFRAALLAVPPLERDAWLDRVLGLGELPDDGALPEGGVPYLPCAVDDLLRVVEHVRLDASDVFVDLGSGVGRAAACVHLLTGASTMGIEVQPHLVVAARQLAARLGAPRVSFVEGDAAALVGHVAEGSVYFLYCPFSGARLATALRAIEAVARTRPVRVCCVDLPLPACPWLTLEASPRPGLEIHVSAFASRG